MPMVKPPFQLQPTPGVGGANGSVRSAHNSNTLVRVTRGASTVSRTTVSGVAAIFPATQPVETIAVNAVASSRRRKLGREVVM